MRSWRTKHLECGSLQRSIAPSLAVDASIHLNCAQKGAHLRAMPPRNLGHKVVCEVDRASVDCLQSVGGGIAPKPRRQGRYCPLVALFNLHAIAVDGAALVQLRKGILRKFDHADVLVDAHCILVLHESLKPAQGHEVAHVAIPKSIAVDRNWRSFMRREPAILTGINELHVELLLHLCRHLLGDVAFVKDDFVVKQITVHLA
mmetsp:Transcript_46267/g.121352  ORF Transcript_46267/g.121352 Transcript_46267/m.121352 type:complete len:203 (-) Transcript_46267:407-1015(-)